jgi:hypothetical protein
MYETHHGWDFEDYNVMPVSSSNTLNKKLCELENDYYEIVSVSIGERREVSPKYLTWNWAIVSKNLDLESARR